MIPVISITAVLLMGIALAVTLIAILLRRTRLTSATIPLPVALVLAVGLAGAGIAYVATTLRETAKEPVEETTAPAGAANMTQMMGRMGSGGAPPMDPKRPFITLIQKLEQITLDESFTLSSDQRAELKALLSPLPGAEQFPPNEAMAKMHALHNLLSEDQLKQVEAVQLERSAERINYTTDTYGNPFQSGPPRESLDRVLEFVDKPSK